MGWRDEDKIYTENEMQNLRCEIQRLHKVIMQLRKENKNLKEQLEKE